MNQRRKGKLFVISGPSGVGKGTLVRMLLMKYPEIKLSISATTRQPRPGEVRGVDYIFMEQDNFIEMAEKGYFLEWAEFAGNYYGTDGTIVEKTIEQGHNLLLEIDVKGALQVKTRKPEAVLVFIEPPSMEELKSRLFKRKTESEEDIQKRLAIVHSEIEQKVFFNYSIINDNLSQAFIDLEKTIRMELQDTENVQ
jgi:guanylate kinase